MDKQPICPKCANAMWLVTVHDAGSHYECFYCPDEAWDPEQQPPEELSNAFARGQQVGWWRDRNRPFCDSQHIGPDGIFRKYSLSTLGAGERMRKTDDAMPLDQTRHYSFVYCRCGRSNIVHDSKPNDKISFFCLGCARSLDYQSNDIRQDSVTAPFLSLRDYR